MSKHNDKKFMDVMKQTFNDKLLEQYKLGIGAGAHAIASVVYKKATMDDKTAEEKIQLIVDICGVLIDAKKADIKNKGESSGEVAELPTELTTHIDVPPVEQESRVEETVIEKPKKKRQPKTKEGK